MTYLQFSLPLFFFTFFGFNICANAGNTFDRETADFVYKIKEEIRNSSFYYSLYSEKLTDLTFQDKDAKKIAENNDFERALQTLKTSQGRKEYFENFLQDLPAPSIMNSKKPKYYFKKKKIKFLLSVAKEQSILTQETAYKRMIKIKKYHASKKSSKRKINRDL